MTDVATPWSVGQADRLLGTASTLSIERLANFLKRWQALGATPASDFAPSGAMAARMAPVLRELGLAFHRARASGAFANVWQVTGIGRDERRNAQVLAWLLEPRGTHGLGAEPLRIFFDTIGVQPPPDLDQAMVHVEHRPLNSVRDRFDIMIDHIAQLVVVEVKVDAGLGYHQLPRYLEAAAEMAGKTRRRHLVLLAVGNVNGVPPYVTALRWRDLALAFQPGIAGAPRDSHIAHHLRQLLGHFLTL